MADTNLRRAGWHVHEPVVTHAVRQQAGIPYEMEQRVCSQCRRLLDERQLRRAAA